MKNKLTFIIIGFAVLAAGCFNASGDYPGTEYMPDMKHSRAYEIYTPNPVFKNGLTAQLPAEGSVARGFLPYTLPNTNEGYETAGRTVTSPFNSVEHKMAIEEGKALFVTYCSVCHGKGGKGDGTLMATSNGKYPPPPSYFKGKMFHSITHGKNMMGGYYSQVSQTERWKIISFIKDLQAKHIAKESKISEAAALNRVFKGAGFISEAAYAKQQNEKHAHDAEYADLMPNIEKLEADYNFKFRFNQHGKGNSDGHGDDHGHGGHGDDHGHGHDGGHDDHHDNSHDKNKKHDDHGKKGHH